MASKGSIYGRNLAFEDAISILMFCFIFHAFVLCNSLGTRVQDHSLEALTVVKTESHFVPSFTSMIFCTQRNVINELSVLKARKCTWNFSTDEKIGYKRHYAQVCTEV